MCGFKSVDLLAILLNHSLESQDLWSRFTPLGKSLSLQLRSPTSPACWSAGGILFPPTTCWQSRWGHSLIHHLRTHSTGVTGSPEGTLWGQTFFIPLALLHCKIPARLILWLHNYVNRKNFKCRLIYLMLIFFSAERNPLKIGIIKSLHMLTKSNVFWTSTVYGNVWTYFTYKATQNNFFGLCLPVWAILVVWDTWSIHITTIAFNID